MVRGIYRLGVAALVVAAMGQAPASAGDDEVRREGSCSNRSDWELRAKRDDGAFRIRWRVDSGIAGQTWRMRVFHNGTEFASGVRTTNADGEATIDRRGVPDLSGPDAFRGFARNPNTGETCAGRLTI